MQRKQCLIPTRHVFQWSMWADGEPDHYSHDGPEDCALLDMFHGDGKFHDFQLADVICDRKEQYICEYRYYNLVIRRLQAMRFSNVCDYSSFVFSVYVVISLFTCTPNESRLDELN